MKMLTRKRLYLPLMGGGLEAHSNLIGGDGSGKNCQTNFKRRGESYFGGARNWKVANLKRTESGKIL